MSKIWEERGARRGGRIVGLADSRVTLCSRLQGRSSSRAIRASPLRRAPSGACRRCSSCVPLHASIRVTTSPTSCPLRSSAGQRPAWLGRECTASGSSTRRPRRGLPMQSCRFACVCGSLGTTHFALSQTLGSPPYQRTALSQNTSFSLCGACSSCSRACTDSFRTTWNPGC